MVPNAAITTEHGFPLTMNGDPLARVCAACGSEFWMAPGEPISRFTGRKKSGGKADRPARRYCTQKCAAKDLGDSLAGVSAMRTHWSDFHASRTDKRCCHCHEIFPIYQFRHPGNPRKTLGECRACRNKRQIALYATPGRYVGVIVSAAKTRARKAGLPFELTREWAIEKLESQGWKCHYSGVNLTMGGGKGTVSPTNVSIDRVIPAKGYTQDNVVFCAAAVNIAKNIWGIDDLLKWADRIRAWRSENSAKETN